MTTAREWTPDGDLASIPANPRWQAANDNVPPATCRPRVIALTGRAGAGKSTVAAHLQSKGYELIKFADPLKSMMRAFLKVQNVTDQDAEAFIEGDMKEMPSAIFGGQSARYAMQTLGTEWGRECMGDNFWTVIWADRAMRFPLVVVDDCRFPNEAAVVRRMGGRIVQLVGRGGIAGKHASEAGTGISDAVIENDGTIADLLAKVDAQIGEWVA